MNDKPPGSRNRLAEYTKPECEHFREHCNFTPEELDVFSLRSRNWSVAHISMELHVCERTVNRRIKSIQRKIARVQ